jgi:hypothetical protein
MAWKGALAMLQEPAKIDLCQDPKSSPTQLSLKSWTVSIATALVVFILLGVLLHFHW